jgi:hypothetical protein
MSPESAGGREPTKTAIESFVTLAVNSDTQGRGNIRTKILMRSNDLGAGMRLLKTRYYAQTLVLLMYLNKAA